jgi:hypothetical protein
MKITLGATLSLTVLWAVNVAAQSTPSTFIPKNSLVTWENYEKIKAKALTWTPFTPDQHPFRDYTDEEIARISGKPSFAR